VSDASAAGPNTCSHFLVPAEIFARRARPSAPRSLPRNSSATCSSPCRISTSLSQSHAQFADCFVVTEGCSGSSREAPSMRFARRVRRRSSDATSDPPSCSRSRRLDEYDVQDLMHALLWLHFVDVRPEEYTPSYAGKASRMDFLLKRESIVVELKMTRAGLGAKELSSQLIEDIERYKAHPDCQALLCFVYDPAGLIPNPRGIEADLDRDDGPFPVRVLIRP